MMPPNPKIDGMYSGTVLWMAVWAGKATAALSRLTRRGGGTTLPGDVARLIDPHVLRKLAADLKFGSLAITGTNRIMGAPAAALESASGSGHLRADWGVFEIDEASLPKAIDEIQPKAALV